MPKALAGESAQIRYQRHHSALGLCTKCPRKAKKWGLCKYHLDKQYGWYEARRLKLGVKTRYKKKRFGKLLPVS